MPDDPGSRDDWLARTLTPMGLYKLLRRLVIAVLGLSVLTLGLALLVLPGPAFIVIPAGLAILALEFGWARRLLRAVRERFSDAMAGRDAEAVERSGSEPATPPPRESRDDATPSPRSDGSR